MVDTLETKNSKDSAKFIARGTIIQLDKGTTNTGIPFLNIVLESACKKYTERIPLVAYGYSVDEILSKAKVGDAALVHGRIRSKTKDNRTSISLVCEQFDKVIA